MMEISPSSVLVDDIMHVRVTGLTPGRSVKVLAEMRNHRGSLFHSYAEFIVSPRGTVGVIEDTPVKGSVRPRHGDILVNGPRPRTETWSEADVTKPTVVDLAVLDATSREVLARGRVERWYKAQGVRRVEVREQGLVGTLFIPEGPGPFPACIDIFGSVGGLTEFRAALLASRGIVALALAYFRVPGTCLPEDTSALQMEYFETAAHWLHSHPLCSSRQSPSSSPSPAPGVIGVSQGGQLALALASICAHVRACVAISSANRITGDPVWYGGRRSYAQPWDLTQIGVYQPPPPPPALWATAAGGSDDAAAVDVAECLYVLEGGDASVRRRSEIEVERAPSASFLLLSGADDRNWHAADMSNEVMARLAAKQQQQQQQQQPPHEHICYPGAGHLIEPPYMPTTPYSYHATVKTCLAWGGADAAAHARAQAHAWTHMLRFLKRALEPASSTDATQQQQQNQHHHHHQEEQHHQQHQHCLATLGNHPEYGASVLFERGGGVERVGGDCPRIRSKL